MESIIKIITVFVFLFSFPVEAQEEKAPSYFSNQIELNKMQLTVNTPNNFQNRSQEKISTISLKQIGDKNFAKIDDKRAYGSHKVYQIGNNNNYQFLNYRNNEQINLSVSQKGNSNSLNIKGTNLMFRNIKITQFGGAKMSVVNYSN